MKIYELNSDERTWLKITDLENIFNVYQDNRDNYKFNLNSTLYVFIADEYLKTYTCTHDMYWSTLSHQLYSTTRLAWVLMKINNVKDSEVFNNIKAGTPVYYIDKGDIQNIVNILNGING